jgi:RHS repeat-associated protein
LVRQTLSGVSDGAVINDVPVAMGVLLGDTTGNGSVNSSDLSQTQSQAGQLVSAANFREGVTVNGAIDSSDIAVVQAHSGTALGSFTQTPPTPGPTYCVFDGWNLIAEYAPGAASPSSAYLAGAGGLVKNLVSAVYYYQDASGSTSHLADSAGNLLEWYRYDLHGTPFFCNASNTQISASAYGIRHLFTGQQWYSEIGLYDLRNRFYSTDIGRFIQPDPISFAGDPTNLYRYTGNSPVVGIDPSGEAPEHWLILGGAAVAGTIDVVAQYYRNGHSFQNFNMSEALIVTSAGGLAGGVAVFASELSPLARIAVTVGGNTIIGGTAQVAINQANGQPAFNNVDVALEVNLGLSLIGSGLSELGMAFTPGQVAWDAASVEQRALAASNPMIGFVQNAGNLLPGVLEGAGLAISNSSPLIPPGGPFGSNAESLFSSLDAFNHAVPFGMGGWPFGGDGSQVLVGTASPCGDDDPDCNKREQ